MEIIDKKEFAAAILSVDNKTFVIYIAALTKPIIIPIYPSCQTQVTLLKSEKTEILAEYSNFSDIFLLDSVEELPEHTRINDYSINLLNNKQLTYGSIYSLRPMELEILKTYIKVNLDKGFIRPSKSFAATPILFV